MVWDDASRMLVRGVNPYANWRDMPNAYPYLPVFLYMLLPLQGLALHTALPFTLLGKLPVVIADLVVGATLYRWLLNAGRPSRVGVAAACLYLFNPLVLYNGAFLGRFDAVALAFLLPALMADGPRFAILYGLAVATKTFPIFILPALLLGRYRRAPRELVGTLAVVLVIALPFLLWDPHALFYNLTVRAANVVPVPLGLSWHAVLRPLLSPALYTDLLYVFLLLFVGAVVLWRDQPPLTLCALTFSAFLLIDHKVWEQYLTWPLPFLIALALLRRDLRAGLLAVGLSLAAFFDNYQGPGMEPAGRRFHIYMRLLPHPTVTVNVLLALGIVLYIVLAWRLPQRPGEQAELRALRRTPPRRDSR